MHCSFQQNGFLQFECVFTERVLDQARLHLKHILTPCFHHFARSRTKRNDKLLVLEKAFKVKVLYSHKQEK